MELNDRTVEDEAGKRACDRDDEAICRESDSPAVLVLDAVMVHNILGDAKNNYAIREDAIVARS